jgi:hypothetical protein
MKAVRKIGIALAAIMFVLLGGVVVSYWWSNTVPRRPKGVSGNAVFLWAPYVGVPGPRRGWWLACWEQSGTDYCRLNRVDGTTDFEGQFVPYHGTRPVPADQLRIDPSKTQENKVWVGDALVPLVYLEGGEILIPASSYEDGKRLLDGVRPTSQ